MVTTVEVNLKDIEPIAEILNSFVEVLNEIETKDYVDSEGVNVRESSAFKKAANIIMKSLEDVKHETSCR